MHNPKKKKYSITGLIIAGIVPFFVELSMIMFMGSFILIVAYKIKNT
jgi:hypothetical protein